MPKVNTTAITPDHIGPFVEKLQSFLAKYKGSELSLKNSKCALALYGVVNQIPGVCDNINLLTNENIIYKNGRGILGPESNLAHIAVCLNAPILIDFFLNRRGQINCRNRDKETPLRVALRLDNIDIAIHILRYAPHEPNDRESYDETRPLVSLRDAAGNSVLHVVAGMQADSSGNAPKGYEALLDRVIDLFRSEGGDFNAPNKQGDNAAHIAVLKNNSFALERLLRTNKVDLLSVDRNNRNVLQLICSKEFGADFDALAEQLILNLKQPPTLEDIAADDSAGNFLTVCAKRNALNTIKIALQTWGADRSEVLQKMLRKKNNRQLTPLDIAACKTSDFDIHLLEILLSIDPPGSTARDALIRFIYSNFRKNNKKIAQESLSKPDIEKALLCLLAKAELQNNDLKWSVLHCLAKANKLPEYAAQIVLNTTQDGRALREMPSFLRQDKNGDNPLHLAIKNDNDEVFFAILNAYDKHISINNKDVTTLDSSVCGLADTNNDSLNIAQLAIQKNNKKIFLAIVKKVGARMLLQGTMGGETNSLIHLALLGKKFDWAMECLDFLQSNSDKKGLINFILQKNNGSGSLAHLASQKGGEELFIRLYNITPDMLHIEDGASETPLGLAFRAGLSEALQVILQDRRDVVLKWADSSRDYAVSCIAKSMDIYNLQLIRDNDALFADVAEKMFIEAIKQDRAELIAGLLKQRPEMLHQNLSIEGSGEISALCLAAYLGKESAIRSLIAIGAKIDSSDRNGNTVMHSLLQDYIDNDTQNRSNTQNEKMLYLLLGYNFNIALTNANGLSVASLIIQTGNKALLSKALENFRIDVPQCVSHSDLLQAIKAGLSKRDFCKLLLCSPSRNAGNIASAITQDMVDSVAKDQTELKHFMCFHKGLSFAIKNETGFFAPLSGVARYLKNFYEWHVGGKIKEDPAIRFFESAKKLGRESETGAEYAAKDAKTRALTENPDSVKEGRPAFKVNHAYASASSAESGINNHQITARDQ